jgi:RNA polymerase sigma factor (sigma-70 family)
METNDRSLLTRSQVIRRYAGLVYSTSRRILEDESLAADAAQETFLDLARNAHKVTGSLGGWLHRVATRRSVDLIRQSAARRRREQVYAQTAGPSESTWAEVSAHVDQALLEIPYSLREMVVLYFMEQKSMTHIAARHGVSQPTVSRRIAEGLQQLRARLAARGIGVGTVPLQGMLLNGRWEVPEGLLSRLGDIPWDAPFSAGASASGSSHLSLVAAAKWAATGAAASLMACSVWLWVESEPVMVSAPLPQLALRRSVEKPPEPAEPVRVTAAEVAMPSSSGGLQPQVNVAQNALRPQPLPVRRIPAPTNAVPPVRNPASALPATNALTPALAAAPAPGQQNPGFPPPQAFGGYPPNAGNWMRVGAPAMTPTTVVRNGSAFTPVAGRNQSYYVIRKYNFPVTRASTTTRTKRGSSSSSQW